MLPYPSDTSSCNRTILSPLEKCPIKAGYLSPTLLVCTVNRCVAAVADLLQVAFGGVALRDLQPTGVGQCADTAAAVEGSGDFIGLVKLAGFLVQAAIVALIGNVGLQDTTPKSSDRPNCLQLSILH